MNSRGILITGPPRSGTSAVAGMLHEIGLYLGTRLVPAGPNNPRGHFEDLDFQMINDRAMGGFYTPRNLVTEHDLAMWRMLVKMRESQYAVWCAKDPRFCFTAQYVLPFMSDPHVVICVRNRDAIVDSMDKMTDDMDRTDCEALTDKYIHALDTLIDGISQSYPVCQVGYDYVVDQPEEALESLLDFVLPREWSTGFITKELRHHT